MVERPEGVQRIFYSWDEYVDLIHSLERLLEGQKFDFIVAIKRGGWILGVILAHKLGGRLFSSDEIRMLNFAPMRVRKMRFLVVDDVSDTGGTLKGVLDYFVRLAKQGVFVEYKVATLFRKPWTKVEPDYFVKSTERWIVFPYEVDE